MTHSKIKGCTISYKTNVRKAMNTFSFLFQWVSFLGWVKDGFKEEVTSGVRFKEWMNFCRCRKKGIPDKEKSRNKILQTQEHRMPFPLESNTLLRLKASTCRRLENWRRKNWQESVGYKQHGIYWFEDFNQGRIRWVCLKSWNLTLFFKTSPSIPPHKTLNSGTTGILDPIILPCGDCHVHWKIFSSIPGP